LLAQWREGGADPHDTTMLAIGRDGFLDVQRLHVRVENGRTVTDVRSDERLRWWTEPLRPGDAVAADFIDLAEATEFAPEVMDGECSA